MLQGSDLKLLTKANLTKYTYLHIPCFRKGEANIL